MSYEKGDGLVYLPIHKTDNPPKKNPFSEEEYTLGLKALSAYKYAFGGILLPDELHFEGMEEKEQRRYINFAKEYDRLKEKNEN